MYRLLLIFLLFGCSFFSRGEGTRELQPTAADFGGLMFNNNINDMPMGLFTPNPVAYPAGTSSADYRINIRIANANEVIYAGFRRDAGDPIYFQLKNPLGVIVVGPTLVTPAPLPYNQFVAGPFPIVGATGYTPQLTHTALMTGDYYIEFNAANGAYVNTQVGLQYFDITVASPGNIAIPGRLWSRAWQITTFGNAPNRFNGSVFAYSDDGIVNRIRFTNMFPFTFGIVCNSFGVYNTGNNLVDRRSIQNGLAADPLPQYRIFLNDPDPAVFPTGSFGNIIGTPTISGCGNTKCLNVEVDKAGKAEVVLDLNGTAGYQVGTTDRLFNATLVVGVNCIPWDGLDGLGNPVASGTSIDVLASYQNSLFHMPLFDIESNANGFQVSLVRPAGPTPLLFWDDSQLLNVGASTDGIVNLTGCNGGIGCHRWTGKGNNACLPCPEIMNTWWYSNSISSSSVTTIEDVVIDAHSLTAGNGFVNNNFKVCTSTLLSTLSGSVAGPPTVAPSWTSSSGSTFTSTTAATPGYTPSPSALAAGFDMLYLDVTGATCPVAKDSVYITFITEASSNAGTDISVCQNNATSNLSSSVAPAGPYTLSWSGGAGNYVPNSTTLHPDYVPSASELASGTVSLTLTVTPTDPTCPPISDVMTISITPAPTLNAGPDTIVCANNNLSVVSASVNNASAVSWTSSSGCVACFSSTNTNNTNYAPNATDLSNTNVTLTISASEPGCNVVTDTKTITYTPAPVANAGADQSICSNNALVALAGTSANTTSVSWSSTSLCNTCFSSTNVLNTSYLSSATDTVAGSVGLVLTGLRAGCNPVRDTMVAVFTPSPSISAGPDLFVCANNPCLAFNAIETIATGVQWSNGNGTFAPNANAPAGTYCLSAAEILSGQVSLVATTTGNGNCLAVDDTVLVAVTPAPIVNAGVDQVGVCFTPGTVSLAGTSSTGFATWSGGAGAYTSITNLNTTYNPAVAEKSGTVVLTLTSTNNGLCNAVSDQLSITFTPPIPSVIAGVDTVVCTNTKTLDLNAINLLYSSVSWFSNGGGNYSSANNISTTYSFAPSDTSMAALWLIFNAVNSCGGVQDTVIVTFNSAPVAMAGADLIAGASGQTVNLAGTGSSVGSLISYNWYSPDVSLNIGVPENLLTTASINSLPATAILSVYDSATYCSNTDTMNVRPIDIQVPNIFSPNNDGINDQFRIKNIEYFPEAELKVYDQWSNMIFSANPAYTYFWDGTYKGEELPASTYYYTLDLKVKEFPEMKGNVTIVR